MGESIMKLRISKGRVFSELKALKPGSTFEISTPQAIAGVRGTAWETVVDEVLLEIFCITMKVNSSR